MANNPAEFRTLVPGEWEEATDEHGRSYMRRPAEWTRERLWRRKLESAGIREPAVHLAKYTPLQLEIYQLLQSSGCNAILHGKAQRGKTEVAMRAAREILMRGADVEIGVWLSIKKRFEPPSLEEHHWSELEVFEALSRPHLLVIDEVGQGNPEKVRVTDHEHAVFTRLISLRHGRRKWTWITSNLSRAQLESLYGEPAISRLAEQPSVIADFSEITQQFRYQSGQNA